MGKFLTALHVKTTGLLEIARKNFKTFTSAVIFIIALLICPKFSRLFSVATYILLFRGIFTIFLLSK